MWLGGKARPPAEELVASEKRLALPSRLRIQNFDLIRRHDVDLGLALAKFDCARDADDFSLDHSKSLIGRHSGPGRLSEAPLL